MKFFIDTANLDEILAAAELGVLDGVTTKGLGVYRNPVYLVFKKQPIIQRTCT